MSIFSQSSTTSYINRARPGVCRFGISFPVAHVRAPCKRRLHMCPPLAPLSVFTRLEVYVSRGVWLTVAIAREQKQFSVSQLIHRDEWGDLRTRQREERGGKRCIRAKLQEDVGNDECRTLSETNTSAAKTVANDLSR